MSFLRWMLPTPYPWVAVGIPLIVAVMGYGWVNIAVALILSVGIFISAGWVDYRRHGVEVPEPSVRASQARAKSRWPAPPRLEGQRHAAGVFSASARTGGHVVVFVPEGDRPWAYVRIPSLRGRRALEVLEFAGYEAMVAQLESERISYLPPSPYARNVIDSLVLRLAKRGVTRESIASGTSNARVAAVLDIAGPLTVGGPRYAEFDRRIPTRAEADQIVSEGLGLALRRVPQPHRDLAFLEWFPTLRGLWIQGTVDTTRIGSLSSLTQLSLLETGSDEVDLSGLKDLAYYEGELNGRETVLGLPSIRELYLGRVDEGRLDRIPPTVVHLVLHGAVGLQSLAAVEHARGLRDLDVQGPRHLDISPLSSLSQLRTLRLLDIERLTGIHALRSMRGLRELHLEGVGSIDAPETLDSLRGVDVVVAEPGRNR